MKTTASNPGRAGAMGLLAALAAILGGAVAAQAAPAASRTNQADGAYRLLADVPYGMGSNTPLLMNITLPNPEPVKPVPAVILLHGGGWSGGTRGGMMSQCFLVAQHGYVGVSVEYRLSGQAPFPLPQGHSSLRPGFLSAITGCCGFGAPSFSPSPGAISTPNDAV